MIRMKRIAFAITALAISTSNFAAWPDDKPIEVVVGFAPGGGTDLIARKLFTFVQKRLGGKAQFVVVNKPGASGELGNAYVAKAQPDGYTLGIVNVPAFLYLPLVRKTQYQVEDFQLAARIVDDPTVLITRSEAKIDNLPTVIGIAKQTPGVISVGHNGDGSNGELVLQLLRGATGVELTGVPYKGTGPQKIDVLGGYLPLGTVSAGEVPELHKEVKRPSKQSFNSLPNAPLERAWMASPALGTPQKPLTFEELSKYPIGAQYSDTIHARLQSAWFTRAGHPLRNTIQAHSLSVLGKLTLSGLTVAQLPIGVFAEELKSKRLVRISVTRELPDVQYFAVYRRSTAHHLAPKVQLWHKTVVTLRFDNGYKTTGKSKCSAEVRSTDSKVSLQNSSSQIFTDSNDKLNAIFSI